MEHRNLKRVNVIVDAELYHKAKVLAFVRGISVSEIFRQALDHWLSSNFNRKAGRALAADSEPKLLEALSPEGIVPSESAKKKSEP